MLIVSSFQFWEFVLFVPKIIGSAELDFTEPEPATTTLPFWASHDSRTPRRKGVIILAVVVHPVTIRV